MKDITHHLRNIQRKIIRLNRQEELQTTNNKPVHTNTFPLEEMSFTERRKQRNSLTPKKIRT